jgi:hypothetical protein
MAKKKVQPKTLSECEQAHRRLAERLAEVGFIWPGSLARRYLTCGNPKCACRRDPGARHGPYTYWSSKKAGKTISKKLSEEEAERLGAWVKNRQEVQSILEQMMEISSHALRVIEKRDKNRDQKSRP